MKRKKNNYLTKKILITHHVTGNKKELLISDVLSSAGNLISAGFFHDAVFLLEQLYKQYPKFSEVYFYLLESYRATGQYQKGHALITKFDGNAAKSGLCLAAAQFYLYFFETEAAQKYAKKHMGYNPKDLNGLRFLSQLHLQKGDVEKSCAVMKDILNVSKKDVPALYNLANTKGKNLDDDIKNTITALLDDQSFSAEDRVRLYFAAAYTSDDDSRFDLLSKANNLADGIYQNDTSVHELGYDHRERFIKLLLADESKQVSKESAVNEQQLAFVASMPRSGSTLLEQMMSSHSQVGSVGESEAFHHAIQYVSALNGLSKAYWEWPLERIMDLRNSLADYFQSHGKIAACESPVLLDKSINNMYNATFLLWCFPNAKVIYLKRNPMDLTLSCYERLFSSGYEYTFSLEKIAKHYLLLRKYEQLCTELFPERVLSVDYEELVVNQEATLKSIKSFLGLAWEEASVDFHKNVGQVITASNLQVRKGLNQKSIHKWKRFESELAFLKPYFETDFS